MNRKAKPYKSISGIRESVFEMYIREDSIELKFDRMYMKTLYRMAEEMESMMLCRYVDVEEGRLCLMHPDYGLFGNPEEFKGIVSELFEEENYEIIYIE